MTIRNLILPSTLLLSFIFINPTSSEAQFFKRKKKTEQSEDDTKKKSDFKKISAVTKGAEVFEGLFDMYRDTITGESWMAIPIEAFSSEYIYFSQVEDGVLQTGNFRGSYGGSKVISFRRAYNSIEIIGENTSYYFDPESPLSRAEDANINSPILASLKIIAVDKSDSVFLVSADDLFKSEKINMVKPPTRHGGKSALGKLSKEKTHITAFNNYPENLEVIVDYVYESSNPSVHATALTDSRYITVGYRHAILQMPDDGFSPRKDDSRIGFFMTQVNDMTSTSSTPWNDMIHRWRLVKKDPTAELSEPVEPITWWIENTTPYEFREYIKTGVEKWNLAFEKIGFKNAIVVKTQPDDADWDAGDIRYNVLRWTSSPTTPFSGYGPSFVNPRTGEILGADVMLEFAGMAGRLWKSGVFAEEGMDVSELSSREKAAEMMHRCDAGSAMARNTLFSLSAMKIMDFDEEEHQEFVRQTLHRLCLHEVGHTLGLSHNMHASTMLTPDELKDPSVVAVNGMCNSVMEYPAINFARNPQDQTLYYDDSPGPYDYWVIEYAYSEPVEDSEAEDLRLESILSKSVSELLSFGNDADDMRGTGRGINPDVNIYDLSNDPVAYASERCELVNDLLPELVDKYASDASSYHEVRRAYFTLTGEYSIQLRVMTRQIAGVRYNRAGPENIGNNKPYTPVSKEDQKAAMTALSLYAFSPHAFDAASSSYAYLQAQRRGFGFFGRNEDPKIHSRVLGAQVQSLAHLLHPSVLQRLTDTGQYGNEYDVATYMNDLTDAMFKADLKKSVNTFRQQLQVKYVEMLISSIGVKSRTDYVSRGVIISQLNRIYRQQIDGRSPNSLTRAHRAHINHIIDRAFER
jgi:hypothetical protein